jgi:hypothetical protein
MQKFGPRNTQRGVVTTTLKFPDKGHYTKQQNGLRKMDEIKINYNVPTL